uniref:Uncharacterized protein n=1 Tax=Anguilla anguilla TaxID=7936 RepID=A0A0E9VHT2_ANGAN
MFILNDGLHTKLFLVLLCYCRSQYNMVRNWSCNVKGHRFDFWVGHCRYSLEHDT